MSCNFPLHAYKAKSNQTDKIKITFSRPSSWRGEPLNLPCGQCTQCRLEKSRQWAVRCMHEASLWEKNSFVTLTYNDENIPSNKSLQLDHFQRFIKRLRRSVDDRIRYYHCGEYGELNERPHYHALLFNYRPGDLKLFSERDGRRLYTSDSLSKLWPLGFSTIGEVEFESAAYVARYIMKKVTGDRASSHYAGRKPEYTTMSRRPGIGKGWYEKFKADVYPSDRVIVRGVVTRPPRFYDGLLGSEDRSTLEFLKIKRENQAQKYTTDTLSDGRVIRVSEFSAPRLLAKNECVEAKIKMLTRSL